MKRRLVLTVLIMILAAGTLGATWTSHLRSPRSLHHAPGAHTMPYVVLIVLDGARPDYFSVPGIPHIKALMRNGTQYTAAWAGILESETPSGHAALTTGSNPNRNGILSFGWANSDNTSVNLFDPAKIQRGEQREIMRKAGAPTIARAVHQRDPHARVVSLGGHKYYANDAMGGPDADVIMYYTGMADGRFVPVAVPHHTPPLGVMTAPGLATRSSTLPMGVENHLAMKLAITTFQRMHQRVTLLNLPEFDWPLGHVLGGSRDRGAVQRLMQGFDRDLAALQETYRRAGVLKKTVFILTSDHGTTTIQHTVPKETIQAAVAQAGTKIVSDTYHTAAFVWLRDKTRAAAAAANISHLQHPHIQSVYFKQSRPENGFHYLRASGADRFHATGMESANQYLLNTFSGSRGPDIVVQFTQGTASLPGAESSWHGDHGGADWESQHIPLVFSGPGVKRGIVSAFPARLVDIAPTMLTLIHASPARMQGTVLADALRKPTGFQATAQVRQKGVLNPVVQALHKQSHAEATGQ